jgi:hypothetical protein
VRLTALIILAPHPSPITIARMIVHEMACNAGKPGARRVLAQKQWIGLRGNSMLQELIQRWRRIDPWPEVNATVVSREVVSEGGYKKRLPSVRITFYYRDASDLTQSGELVADSFTPLYNLRVNDTFRLRVNQSRPSQFYTVEANSLFNSGLLVYWVCLGVVSVIILFVLFTT